MEKWKFSVIELIAVLIILSMLVIILVPTLLKTNENDKKEKYIEDVNNFIIEAQKLYGSENSKKLFIKSGNDYSITLDKISNLSTYKDPYGYNYDKQASSITFRGENIIINVKSCLKKGNLTECHEIVDVNKQELNTNSITTTLN